MASTSVHISRLYLQEAMRSRSAESQRSSAAVRASECASGAYTVSAHLAPLMSPVTTRSDTILSLYLRRVSLVNISHNAVNAHANYKTKK